MGLQKKVIRVNRGNKMSSPGCTTKLQAQIKPVIMLTQARARGVRVIRGGNAPDNRQNHAIFRSLTRIVVSKDFGQAFLVDLYVANAGIKA